MHLYKQMLQAGVAKECARDVLPLSAPTTLYMHGNLRSFLHYTDLRASNGTQRAYVHCRGCQRAYCCPFPAMLRRNVV